VSEPGGPVAALGALLEALPPAARASVAASVQDLFADDDPGPAPSGAARADWLARWRGISGALFSLLRWLLPARVEAVEALDARFRAHLDWGGGAEPWPDRSEAPLSGIATFSEGLQAVTDGAGRRVVISRSGAMEIFGTASFATARVLYGAELLVGEGDRVEAGATLARWDRWSIPVLELGAGGRVRFADVVEGVSAWRHGGALYVRASSRPGLRPRLVINEPGGSRQYFLGAGARIEAVEGHAVVTGDVLARLPGGGWWPEPLLGEE